MRRFRSYSQVPMLLFFAFCVLKLPTATLAQTQLGRTPQTVTVKIEAAELDRQMLLEKLNAHGKDHHLRFALAEGDYEYRIGFGTGQGTVNTTYGEINASEALTRVFDSRGILLFEFKRAGRFTDSGATNAAAKEIIKRMLKLRPASQGN